MKQDCMEITWMILNDPNPNLTQFWEQTSELGYTNNRIRELVIQH